MYRGDDRGLVREHDVLCRVWIAGVGQKTPVDIRSVTDIWIIVLGCRSLEYPLYQALCLLGPLEEEFDHSCEDLQLCLDGLVEMVAYIRREEQTEENSSLKPSTKPFKISPALLIFSAYSPTIQMSAALALGSSNSSMHWHRVGMIPS